MSHALTVYAKDNTPSGGESKVITSDFGGNLPFITRSIVMEADSGTWKGYTGVDGTDDPTKPLKPGHIYNNPKDMDLPADSPGIRSIYRE